MSRTDTPSRTLREQANASGGPLEFASFAGAFNMMPQTSMRPIITGIILSEIQKRREPLVLDIGCGKGIAHNATLQREIAAASAQFWGVEPDTSLVPPGGLFHRYISSTLEEAKLPDSTFDVAYAVFVMEHVTQPERFLRAAHRALKPGGVMVFLTPNAAAFFGFASRWLHRARVDELVLRLLRRNFKDKPDHYPIASRCNTEAEVMQVAETAGFARAEFAYFQLDGVERYFPGALRPFFHLLMAKRQLLKNPRSLDTMICRVTR